MKQTCVFQVTFPLDERRARAITHDIDDNHDMISVKGYNNRRGVGGCYSDCLRKVSSIPGT